MNIRARTSQTLPIWEHTDVFLYMLQFLCPPISAQLTWNATNIADAREVYAVFEPSLRLYVHEMKVPPLPQHHTVLYLTALMMHFETTVTQVFTQIEWQHVLSGKLKVQLQNAMAYQSELYTLKNVNPTVQFKSLTKTRMRLVQTIMQPEYLFQSNCAVQKEFAYLFYLINSCRHRYVVSWKPQHVAFNIMILAALLSKKPMLGHYKTSENFKDYVSHTTLLRLQNLGNEVPHSCYYLGTWTRLKSHVFIPIQLPETNMLLCVLFKLVTNPYFSVGLVHPPVCDDIKMLLEQPNVHDPLVSLLQQFPIPVLSPYRSLLQM